jgi:ArsR family transcriptional regulator, cadmium/lead-responsive transcriptional repressor
VRDDVLVALVDPTRRRVLELIAEQSRSASALARELPVSRAAVIKHVAVLERTGLVRADRVGREVRCVARPEPPREAARWFVALTDTWDRRLTALQSLAEHSDSP